MSIEPMRQSTNLYKQINEALKPIYLTEDEYSWLNEAISYWRENCEDVCDDIDNEGTNLHDVLERLDDIVITPQEDY